VTRTHWTDAYYGDLYFDSAADLLTPALSAAEAGVVARLLRLAPGARVLDLACGHGRHAWPLAALGYAVVGLERSEAYLRRAAAGRPGGRREPRWIRADLRELPLNEGTFDGAFSWYASLFMFDEPRNLACLAAAGRLLRRGRRLVVQHANPLRLDAAPVDASRRVLADGSVVEEESRWDAASGVDRCARRLRRPSGEVLAATAELRYYAPREWGPLAEAAGLRLLGLTTTAAVGEPSADGPGIEAPDLVAVLERPA
jgi:SAM-dependent methyltransferase